LNINWGRIMIPASCLSLMIAGNIKTRSIQSQRGLRSGTWAGVFSPSALSL
jgi:hypothetical protein